MCLLCFACAVVYEFADADRRIVSVAFLRRDVFKLSGLFV